ncbi:protein-L-isoaspartate O-methyltransferase [Limnohabitans sp. Rim8]|uniref:protein-L-isoaspartate O-methyltransferase family protein n=1 Tax=Limnohabitans sp. Rim8 TaxID=1100718 RepID=UPI0026365F5A|nr:protein-L-isoaspartate O-methyltransferase [Limnohabitans sp. Rim8]
MDLEQARFNMIEQQIRPWEVLDGEVLALLSTVKREHFVPAGLQALAFVDMELPLRGGGAHGQAMLAPRLEARLLQDLAVQKHEKVLEIGTGSGYMAALLGRRAAHVLTLEIEHELATQARKNLATENVSNVEVRQADGANGAAAEGPFDVIVLSGSVAEVPQALLAQLKVGGRLAAIVGQEPMMRATFITRNSDTAWTTAEPWDTVAPRLVHFAEHSHFRF